MAPRATERPRRQRSSPPRRAVELPHTDLRALARWAADCAARVLPLFETIAPRDTRPRDALVAIREFARGGARTTKLRTIGWAAHRAAREVDNPAASAAARAACLAAATAFMHPIATPHQSRHVLGSAVYAVRARELAVDTNATEREVATARRAGDREIRWAIEHAPPSVRTLLRRLPARAPGRGHIDTLFCLLDTTLRRRHNHLS